MIENQDALRQRIRALLERRKELNITQIGHLTTLGESTVRNWYSHQKDYGQNVFQQIEAAVDRIESLDFPIAQPTVVQQNSRGRRYYEGLTTARHIAETLQFCQKKKAIGVLTGEYGIGKTESIKDWQRSHLDIPSTVIEFKHFTSSSMLTFLSFLSKKLHAGTPRSQGGDAVMQAIVDELNRIPQLLIFDQAEGVRPRVFQLIRQIWDDCKIGIVIAGSPLLWRRLKESRLHDIGALESRVGIWKNLNGLTRDETVDVLRFEGVTNIDAEGFDLLCRGIGGSMRRLLAVSDLLVEGHSGKPITARTIQGVMGNLWGMQTGRAS